MNRTCPCQSPNPLVRDGTSQAARAQPALDPASALVDGRDTAAYLEYLRKYARQLRYFDLDNQPAGDWAPFLERDVSSAAAAVAAQDAERERRNLLAFADAVLRPGGRAAFRKLLDALFALALRLDGWAVLGAEQLAFPDVLWQQVRGGLRADLRLLIGIHKAAQELGLLAVSPKDTEVSAEQVLAVGLGPGWWPPGTTSWADFVAGVEANLQAFGARASDPSTPEVEKLARALEYLRPLTESFPRTLARTVEAAAGDLERTLTDWPRHEPPMALLLTFLHLFRYALDSLNGLTARHLEYYYQEVLRLRPRHAEADHVFLTFELARHLESHVVPAGTILLGGKDAQGRLLRYALDDDLRLDHTRVGPLLAAHKTAQGLLTAGPVANSADGLGAPLPPEQPGWPALGSDTHPAAAIGFALASPVLLLTEGTRDITLALTLKAPSGSLGALQSLNLTGLFRVELSIAKGWHGVEAPTVKLEGNLLRLGLRLAPEDPPLIRYQRDLHGGALDTEWPVCRVFLVQEATSGQTYDALSELALSRVQVDAHVQGARQLQVETDAGRADPTKPFNPFGPQPLPGSAFSVRCAELKAKALTSLKLELDWLDPSPDLDITELYQAYVLQPPAKTGSVSDISVLASKESADKQTTIEAIRNQTERRVVEATPQDTRELFRVELTVGLGPVPSAMTGSSSRGPLFNAATFNVPASLLSTGDRSRAIDTVRVRLTSPQHGFGHRLFPRIHSGAVIAIARAQQGATNLPPLPHPPITPTLAGLTLTYGARAELGTTASSEDRFFHLHPFGATRETVGQNTPWLPSHPNEGELYIGLENTRPQQRITLLVQAVEGSGDPTLEAAEVSWSYLGSDQRFHSLRGEALGDGTHGLVHSGLVRIVLPSTATEQGGRLPAGRFWLRVSAPARTAATCHLITLRAQAATATLLNPEQHSAHLTTPLPAGSVGKLEQRQAAIKKLEQPIASFGGRAPEAPLSFARRTSERLRHKNRAITPHDYEALVLEAFPSLYKVKCLNHSRLEGGANRELSPGSVTVVTLPNLVGRQGHNPFMPYTSQATLAEVARFLQPLVGPFIQLQVRNPQFEPIQLAFRVRFTRGNDPALCLSRLKQELNAFLSPWAFDSSREIVFGGALHRSTLLHFVEQRPYVDYVTEFHMRHLIDSTPEATVADAETIVPRTSHSILVSHGEHAITLDEESP